MKTIQIHPFSVALLFEFPRPASHLKKDGTLTKAADKHATSAALGDLDNLEKPVLDELSIAGFWFDDRQVTVLSSCKRYSDDPDSPGRLGVVLTW